MSTTSSSLFDNPLKRTILFSTLLAAALFLLALTLPILEDTDDVWYSFLYEDLDKPEADRYNFALVLVETLALSFLYLFTLIAVGSLAELRNNLPSWNEVFVSGAVTLILAFFLPRLSVGGGLAGTESSKGNNHFTTSMQTHVFLLTILGIIMLTWYVMKSAPENENTNK